MYSDKDSTYYYANKLIDISNTDKNYEHLLFALLFANKSATYFNDYGKIKTNLKKIDSLFKNKSDIDTITSINTIKISTFYDKGTYYYKLNDYKTSQKNLVELLETSKKIPDSLLTKQETDLIQATYVLIAKMHSNDGKFAFAEEYYNKAIRFTNNINDTHKLIKLNDLYRLIGELYKRQNKFKASNIYLKKALNYSLNVSKDENSIINEANNIVENYMALKQPDSAQNYLNYIEPYRDSNMPYGFLFYKTKAKLNTTNNDTTTVVDDYNKAISLLKAKWNNLKHPETAQIHQELSYFYFKNGNFNDALFQNELAVKQVHGNDVVNSSINNSEYLKLLKDKLLFQTKAKDFNNATGTSTLAIAVLDSLKPTFKNNADKLLLLDNAFPIFENSLDALYNLHLKNEDENNLAQAFNVIENSKSTLLLDALLSAKATSYANIPEHIIEQEQLYKTEITRLEKQLENSKNEKLEEQLFKLKNDYLNFINNLETNYKSYYNLKYNTAVVSLENIKAFLSKNDMLITYFYGESSLFIMGITNYKTAFYKIPVNTNLNQLIQSIYVLLGDPKSDIKLLNSKTFELYSKILEPFLTENAPKNLIILPDGILNYVPFSALATSKKDTKYLVEDYTVSYANSATLLLQLQQKKENNNQVLAFAPTFENTNFLALPNNIKEAENVLSHFKGDALKNTNATLQNFNSHSTNYSVLHLATHAIFNDAIPENSFLAFAYNDNKEQSLYVRDLYNLKLNSDLVTLSACESGIGKLNRGEGLMSLARGFYFSGANSIASTLWKINDASATQLMDDFYLNLSNKDSKDIALQKAQITFLNKNKDNALTHPYYWSAFVISGNTSSLVHGNYWIYIGLGVLLVLLIIFLIKRSN